MSRSASKPPKPSDQPSVPEREYGPKETAPDNMHNHLLDKLEVLRAFLTTMFSEAAEAGLTKQEVLRAVMHHEDIIGIAPIASLELPERAPAFYAERPDKSVNPIDFLAATWGPYLAILSREDLVRLGEDRLIPAVYSFCQRNNLDPNLHLPPSARQQADEIVATLTPREIEAARIWTKRQDSARRRHRP